ncbi:MAG: tRNA pseudouridine(38-40) synthase TruA [Armatimonadota bacterium]
MRRLRLVLEYDGSRFCGFQRQPDRRSVQETLETALSGPCGHPVRVVAAGRTDTGVHAVGQVVHFETSGRIPAERLEPVANSLLNGELVLRQVEETDPRFHARYSAATRTYRYYVTTRQPTPFAAPFVLYEPRLREHAAERMASALRPLTGRHDFATFCGGMETHTTVRTLHSARVQRQGELLRVELTADAFLRSMVRLITGMLLEVGRGRAEPESLLQALERRDRAAAGMAAPPHGLFLRRVDYPDGYPPQVSAEPVGFAEEWTGVP